MIESNLAGLEEYIENADVLIFKDNMMMGFQFDGHRIGGCAGGVGVERGWSYLYAGALRLFEHDFNDERRVVRKIFDGVDVGISPENLVCSVLDSSRSSIRERQAEIVGRDGDVELVRVVAHRRFMMWRIGNAKNTNLVILKFDFGNAGVERRFVLWARGAGGQRKKAEANIKDDEK